MTPEELKQRTKSFAMNVLNLSSKLPNTFESNIVRYQLAKSGTSVGANYRAACRARSQNEFISKMCIVNEEADESVYWLELIRDAQFLKTNFLSDLLQEAKELTAIFTSATNTARLNREKKLKSNKSQ